VLCAVPCLRSDNTELPFLLDDLSTAKKFLLLQR